ncbi:flavin reductase family protein [Ruminococcaceae bacterium OttesenSCG-928-D13]|nr:flavin reductase family protein [Ruminococcaceae bacterium OttesenSCG-928-D13]
MAKTQWKGGALLAPVPPVLVTTGTLEAPNICTVGWCGMLSTKPPKTYVSLRPSRLSHALAVEQGEFVINLPTAALVRAIDRCGVKSGRDEDKFATCGLTAVAASVVACPTLAESPVSVECRIEQVIPLGSHDMLLADIVAVDVEEGLIDTAGKLRLDKAGLACYAHGEYFALGKKIGSFGFSVRKKKKHRPPRG